MTLEEAIKHAEEVVQEEQYEYQECVATHNMEGAMNCRKYAEEHRQLAEWLKDYKRLLEQKPILDKIKAEIIKKHLSIIEKNDFDNGRTYGYEEVLEIIDKYRGKENADSN